MEGGNKVVVGLLAGLWITWQIPDAAVIGCNAQSAFYIHICKTTIQKQAFFKKKKAKRGVSIARYAQNLICTHDFSSALEWKVQILSLSMFETLKDCFVQ